jgi:putative endonuclease
MSQKTQKQQLGKLGEDLTCRFLIRNGFEVTERNYWQKCGEIDIIVKKANIIHFIEVKSVSCENINDVSDSGYRPEDNLHPWKLERLSRTIQVYLTENGVSDETDWQFDVITIYIDIKSRVSRVNFLENIVL